MRNWTESNMAAIEAGRHMCFPLEPGAEDRTLVEDSRESGAPTLAVKLHDRELRIHSKYHPREEAIRWAKSRKIQSGVGVAFVFGFGLGYQIEALLETRFELRKIIVVEASADIFQAALAARNLSGVFSDPRVSVFAGPCEKLMPVFYAMLKRIEKELGMKDYDVLVHQPSSEALPLDAGELRDMLEYLRISNPERKMFAKERKLNIAANMSAFEAARGVSQLFGTRAGRPIIVAGAGPSLDASLSILKKAAAPPEIVTVDSALAPFHRAGLRPDFVVSGDPQDITFSLVAGLEIKNELLIFFPSSNSDIVSMFGPERALAACSSLAEQETLLDEKHKKGLLNFAGTVIMAALDFAAKTGADPILLIGADFSFIEERTHASGSRVQGLNKRYGRERETQGIDGSPVVTSDVFYLFKRVVEKYYKSDLLGKTHLINCSARGAALNEIPHMPLQSALDDISSRNNQ